MKNPIRMIAAILGLRGHNAASRANEPMEYRLEHNPQLPMFNFSGRTISRGIDRKRSCRGRGKRMRRSRSKYSPLVEDAKHGLI